MAIAGTASRAPEREPEIPGGIMTKCANCRNLLYTKDFIRDLKVCNRCGFHARLSAKERLDITVDEGTLVEFDADVEAVDPLNFPEYESKIARARLATGLKDAILTGEGVIGGHRAMVGISDFGFMGGSMGAVVGEKVTRAFERALERSLPTVIISSSGGARMQEGVLSLMQMAKTSAAVGRLHKAGLPYVCVLADPSTAGVQASYASLADVVLAEPGATIGFTGARVIEQTLKIKLPKDFQSSEFQLEHGMVDLIVPRRQVKETVAQLLEWFAG